jgi:hypothetical protein
MRAVVESAISHLEIWRVRRTDYRRPLASYHTAFRAVRGLHFFKLSYE